MISANVTIDVIVILSIIVTVVFASFYSKALNTNVIVTITISVTVHVHVTKYPCCDC